MHLRAVILFASALAAPASAQDARALFLQHCASCHGETGDGRGTATLDRPARSFRDGGFSHGNTPEAIFRTLTFGIPGTPMPAAPSVLTEADRKALAEFVISLGPPADKVSAAETELRVADRPVIVRGKLPPIAAGIPARPRGLLVGVPEGLAFEYRVDDPRLLGVRQGAFVERSDWLGRGGDALKPLGALLWLSGHGDPGPVFLRADTGAALAGRLTSTSVEFATPVITYELFEKPSESAGRPPSVAMVGEAPVALFRAAGSGFARRFSIESAIALRLRAADAGPETLAAGLSWTVRRRPEGGFEAVHVSGLLPGEVLAPRAGGAEVTLLPGPKRSRDIEVSVMLAPAWDAAVQARWLAEVEP